LLEVEPHVIRSFFDPNLLVATFQEGRYENGAAVAGGYSVSTDGGLTWSRALIPGMKRIDGGPYFRAADSVAGIDLAGNVYLSHVVFGNAQPPPNATVISRSTDRGQSFSAPNLVFSALPETDKTWMTINTFPQSATANRIVVMGNVFGDGRDQLHSSFSDDQGTTSGWHVSYEYLAVLSDIETSWQVSTDLVDWQAWIPDLSDGSLYVSPGDPSRTLFRATIAPAAPATFYRLNVARRNPAPPPPS
jgi:hypothetical protein